MTAVWDKYGMFVACTYELWEMYPADLQSILRRRVLYPIRRYIDECIPEWNHTLTVRVPWRSDVMRVNGEAADYRAMKRLPDWDPDFRIDININRFKDPSEEGLNNLSRTVLHEIIHIHQFVRGDLRIEGDKLLCRKHVCFAYNGRNYDAYMRQPHEIEAADGAIYYNNRYFRHAQFAYLKCG